MRQVALFAGVLFLAGLLRALPVGSALPYLTYVDEGHVLHRVMDMMEHETFDPRWYVYGHATFYAVILAARVVELFQGAMAFPANAHAYYDAVGPVSLVLTARWVVVFFGMGLVLLVHRCARQLGVSRDGALVAMAVAATTPALATRASIVAIDTPAAFFAVATVSATLLAAVKTRAAWFVLPGLCTGFALATKYPAGSIGAIPLAYLLSTLRSPGAALPFVRRAALTGLGAVVGATVAMPSLVLRFDAVVRDLGHEWARSIAKTSSRNYLESILSPEELGWVLTSLLVAGVVALALDAERRRHAAALAFFYAVTLSGLLTQSYQQPRNLLPMVAISLPVLGVVYDAVARRVPAAVARLAAVLLVGLLLVQSWPLVRAKASVVDSRSEAVAWLAQHARGHEHVLVLEELAVLHSELRDLHPLTATCKLEGFTGCLERRDWDYAVVGFPGPGSELPVAEHGFELSARYGTRKIPGSSGGWRTNDMQVDVYRRLGGPVQPDP